jgi:hypothetical protein
MNTEGFIEMDKLLLASEWCEWCELNFTETSVVVKGYEHTTHDVCMDCASIVNLVECRNCDNVANFMQDTIYLTPRFVGICFECDEQ